MFAFSFPPEVLAIGAITGLGYALLAAGLVLVYRGSGVINFAHGEIGAFCASLMAKMVLDWDFPFAVAAIICVALGGVIGGVVELLIVRRLFTRPRLVLLVATLGVGQLLFLANLIIPRVQAFAGYPTAIDRVAEFGTLFLRGEHFAVIAMVPAIVVVLGLFLTRTPYGIAIRASAENPDAASLAGISPKKVSTWVWVLAGALAAVTVILLNPVRNVPPGLPSEALGPGLLLRALAAALIGRLVSLPKALAGGVLIGVVEALMFVNFSLTGAADGALLMIVLGALFLQRTSGGDGEAAGVTSIPRSPTVPFRLAAHPLYKRIRRVGWLSMGVLLLALPYIFRSPDDIFLLSRLVILCISAISISLLVGWSGQLSLGHFAFVGLGSMLTGALMDRGLGFMTATALAVLGGVLAGVVVGIPALRLRGLMLAVTTLAFATASSSWLFNLPELRGQSGSVLIERPKIFFLDLAPQRTFFYVSVVCLVAVIALVSRLRNTGSGRAILAVRDNEERAASLAVSPVLAKLAAFGLSAGLAAFSGALLGALRVSFAPDAFGPSESLKLVSIAIIGGIGTVPGAILGTLYVIGIPTLLGNSLEIVLLTSGAGLLLLLLYLPGGLLEAVYRLRSLAYDAIAKRLPEPDAAELEVVAAIDKTVPAVASRDAEFVEVPLRATGIDVELGGRQILFDVGIEARAGETVGLIGSNGAGKSTLMGALSGFIPITAGTIEALGRDVTGMPAHTRADTGLGRIFQDARLFSDLTVRESLLISLEGREHSEFVPSMLGLPPSRRAERAKRVEADEIISFLGLGRYAENRISTLSTGSRRIVELGCLLGQQARLLLLDEPTAGVAQREAEAFGPLVTRIRDELGATVIMIEHDIPLISSMSDRLYCMSAGKVIAEGDPVTVRDDPGVIAAYLGTDERAINRSDAGAGRLPSATVSSAAPPVAAGDGTGATAPPRIRSRSRRAPLRAEPRDDA